MDTLPPELFSVIATHLPSSTLQSLCLTSRDWYSAAASQLYRAPGPIEATNCAQFVNSVSSNVLLGPWVKELNIHWSSEDAHLFPRAVRSMPNLEHLQAYNLARACAADPTCVDVILGLKRLTSIVWCWCDTFDLEKEVIARLHTLTSIKWDWDGNISPEIEQLIVRSQRTVECIDLIDYPFERVVGTRAVFPNLRYLHLHQVSLVCLIGCQFPALERLKVNYLEHQSLLRRADVLPSLRSLDISCNYSLADQNTDIPSRRTLDHLSVGLADVVDHFVQPEFLEGQTAIDHFCNRLDPFDFSTVRSLELHLHDSIQADIAFGALEKYLMNKNRLKVLLLSDRSKAQSGTRASRPSSLPRCTCTHDAGTDYGPSLLPGDQRSVA